MNTSKQEKAGWRRRIRRQEAERYTLTASPLYRMHSLHALARLLGVSAHAFDTVCEKPHFRNTRSIIPRPGKDRRINEPHSLTLQLHYRLLQLLDRVRRPPFIHSATRGRSCLTNAEPHKNDQPAACADIKRHFESTTKRRLARFFAGDLQMAPDLAARLASLCSVDDHLPLGSPVSPLLAYWAHNRFFDSAFRLCQEQRVTMTLYGDDLCFSGKSASLRLLFKVDALAREHGVWLPRDKQRTFARGSSKVFAGVEIRSKALALPTAKHYQITCDIRRLASLHGSDLEGLVRRLHGQISAARAVDAPAAEKLSQVLSGGLTRARHCGPIAGATAGTA